MENSREVEQRSSAWFSQRAGKATASSIYKIMAKTKTGWGADRANYHAQLVSERLTGVTAESFSNAAMQWGVDIEPQARAMYSLEAPGPVVEVGFLDHPAIVHSGASPDGLVGDRGMLEVKCPNTATHIATLTGAPIDRKYLYQMQWQMACAQRDWCDFVSFDPRLPLEMQIHVRRVERDSDLLAELEAEVSAFLAEVAATVDQLTTLYMKEAA